MATIINSANFSGKYGNHVRIQLSYDILETDQILAKTTIRKYLYLLSDAGYYGSGNINGYIDGSHVGYISSFPSGANILLGSLDQEVYHDEYGNATVSYTAGCQTSFVLGSANMSGTFSLPNIPRKAIITSANDFTDEQQPSMQFTNIAGFEMTAWLIINPSSSSTKLAVRNNIENTGSYTWLLSSEEINQLTNACTGQSATIRYGITTTIGANTYDSYIDKIFSVVNANPIFTAEYNDVNTDIINITGDRKIIVQNHSTIQFSISGFSAQKGATLDKAYFYFQQQTHEVSITSSSLIINWTFGSSPFPNEWTAQIIVTDSRGNSTTKTLNINILEYLNPYAAISIKRHNNYYTPTDILINTAISDINGNNVVTNRLRYKRVDADEYSWSGWNTIPNNQTVTYTSDFDNNYSYDIQVQASDLISTTTYNLVLQRGTPILHVDRLKNSVGINCLPLNSNSLEVNGLDVGESLNNLMTYVSGNEYVIGTIDGNTLYRMMIPVAITGVGVSTISMDLFDIDFLEIWRISGMIFDRPKSFSQNKFIPINTPRPSSPQSAVGVWVDSNNLYIDTGTVDRTDMGLYLFIDYTKVSS